MEVHSEGDCGCAGLQITFRYPRYPSQGAWPGRARAKARGGRSLWRYSGVCTFAGSSSSSSSGIIVAFSSFSSSTSSVRQTLPGVSWEPASQALRASVVLPVPLPPLSSLSSTSGVDGSGSKSSRGDRKRVSDQGAASAAAVVVAAVVLPTRQNGGLHACREGGKQGVLKVVDNYSTEVATFLGGFASGHRHPPRFQQQPQQQLQQRQQTQLVASSHEVNALQAATQQQQQQQQQQAGGVGSLSSTTGDHQVKQQQLQLQGAAAEAAEFGSAGTGATASVPAETAAGALFPVINYDSGQYLNTSPGPSNDTGSYFNSPPPSTRVATSILPLHLLLVTEERYSGGQGQAENARADEEELEYGNGHHLLMARLQEEEQQLVLEISSGLLASVLQQRQRQLIKEVESEMSQYQGILHRQHQHE
eukprot:CAMPEP_0171772046 /NCGR_PEP_ID=MMETSP0991-20121206/54467_1 /TAXON_ID=483369 /ORGANISM="non described non described, Strain CCMP2098" /LENGTH=419 /DNA_ID=CAMNT_0012377523 /DNA_START=124 /DNA_END=1383 /DNA_ORIENTATION=-